MHPMQRSQAVDEVAVLAARFVVEEGMEYAAAKRQAGQQLGLSSRGPWPDNQQLEAAVREHIALFCADTQAGELHHLRELALGWMERLAEFQPHLGGAVWQGTATRHSDVYIKLFCDDSKAPEWALLNAQVNYHPGSVQGARGEPVPALTLRLRSEALGQPVLVHLLVHDTDDQRGALKPDAQGRVPRGDARALRERMRAARESGAA